MKKTIIILLIALLWACEKDQRYCWQCQYADLDKWEVTYKTYNNMTSDDIEALKIELLEENIILRECIIL